MILPTIHLNGTGARRLLDDYRDAADHVREAIAVLQKTAPNYLQGPAIDATTKSKARIAKLKTVLTEIEALAARCNAGTAEQPR